MKLLMEEGMAFLVKKPVSINKTRLLFKCILILGIIAVLSSCENRTCNKHHGSLPYYNEPSFTPHWMDNEIDKDFEITHTIGDFEFRNQDNRVVSQREIEGKVHVANFFFSSCPGICPKMLHNLKMVEKEFSGNPEVLFMSYSVMPWDDSVDKLKEYADNEGISSRNWNLLTGSQQEINTLARTSYFVEKEFGFTRDSSDFLHTEHIILVDENKHIRGIYNGTVELEMVNLMNDIKLLVN